MKKKHLRIITALIGISLLIAPQGCAETSKRNVGDTPAEPDRHGWHEKSILVGRQKRWYRLYQPATLPEKAPVVLLLHGGTQSMRKLFRPRAGGSKEWRYLADLEGFILLVPNGTHPKTGDTRGDRQNWNDVRPQETTTNPDVNDVVFIRELLNTVETEYSVNTSRIYVTGASNGGMMTYRLLMEMPGRFAAAAVFIANLPVQNPKIHPPAVPTPLLIANGTADPLMKWNGGAILRGRGTVRSAAATVAWWLKANRADGDFSEDQYLPDTDPRDGCRIRLKKYPAQANGAPVWFYVMEGGGHAVPSMKHKIPDNMIVRRLIGPVCRDAEGAALAWEFMATYRRNE